MSKNSFLLSITLLVFTTCISVILSFPPAQKENDYTAMISRRRQARNVLQFGYMIQCLTHRNPYEYADYGCWCGIGGQGTPMDALDRCCYVHDKCYDAAIASQVCSSWWKVYFGTYQYTACAICDPLSAYPADDQDSHCKKFLCECDSAAARCFNQSYYNSSLVNYSSSNCK